MAYGRRVAEPSFVPTAEIARAVAFAADHHGDQTRKGTSIPYLQHLLGAASIAMEHGATETETVATVLHDVIEDTDVTEAELEATFGPEVSTIVRWCSAEAKDDADPRTSWTARKQAYIDHLADAPPAAVLVSLADKIHNARAIAADQRRSGGEEAFWDRFNASRAEQIWYFGELLDTYRRRSRDPDARITPEMIEELERAVDELGA